MKRTILFILLLIALLPGAAMAQADDVTHVSVRAGGTALKNLLTDEQKAGVTHLTVTGTLQEDDYAFLREELFKQLKELNLRDADIDTIPAHAFDFDYEWSKEGKRVTLPLKLKYLSDYALAVGNEECVYVLSGDFPKLGNDVFNTHKWGVSIFNYISIELASDNKKLMKEESTGNIYSSDGTVLYYAKEGNIREGLRVIAGHAFEARESWDKDRIIIPSTVDSIGDRVFANFRFHFITGSTYKSDDPFKSIDGIICLAVIPPKLGKDVFWSEKEEYEHFIFDMLYLTVPVGSRDLYKAADGWKDFRVRGYDTGIASLHAGNGMTIETEGSQCVLKSTKDIRKIELFGADGKRISSVDVNCNEANIAKSSLAYPFTLVRVDYKDGTMETVKLRP